MPAWFLPRNRFPNRRRDGRVAEGARLESVFRGNSNVGSNPTLSATQSRPASILPKIALIATISSGILFKASRFICRMGDQLVQS